MSWLIDVCVVIIRVIIIAATLVVYEACHVGCVNRMIMWGMLTAI